MSKSTYYLFGRILRAPLSIPILAFGFMLVPTVAAASIQLPESCRMGACSRATVESKEALRTNNLGTLYSVTKIVLLFTRAISSKSQSKLLLFTRYA